MDRERATAFLLPLQPGALQREDAAFLSSHRHAVSFCTILFCSTRFEFHPCIAEGCCVNSVACARCRVATSCVCSGGHTTTPCGCNMFCALLYDDCGMSWTPLRRVLYTGWPIERRIHLSYSAFLSPAMHDACDQAHLEGSAAGGFTPHSRREDPSGRSACSSLSHLPCSFTPFIATPSFSTTPETYPPHHSILTHCQLLSGTYCTGQHLSA